MGPEREGGTAAQGALAAGKQKCGGAPHIVGPADAPLPSRSTAGNISARSALVNSRRGAYWGWLKTVTPMVAALQFFDTSKASARITWVELFAYDRVFHTTWNGGSYITARVSASTRTRTRSTPRSSTASTSMPAFDPRVAPSAGAMRVTSGPLVSAGPELPRQPARGERSTARRSRRDQRIRTAPDQEPTRRRSRQVHPDSMG